MQNNSFKNYGLSIVVVLCLIGSFYGGVCYEKKQNIDPSVGLNIINNLTSTDFLSSSTASVIDMKPFWEAWKLLDEKFVATKHSSKKATDQEKVWGAIAGMTSSFGDPYTVFMPPTEAKSFDDDIAGGFSGVGMEVGIKDGLITVIAPLKGTPAFKAGMKSGDKIVEINGTSTQDMSVDAAVKIIRGPKGTEVKLKVAREGKKDFMEISIIRDNIDIPTVDTETKDGVFVIHLYNFYAKAPDMFRQALKEFSESGLDKLVLDVRGNPGGYLEAAVDMASWFMPMGKVVVREEGKGVDGEKIHRTMGHQVFDEKTKIAVLIDGGSASASEILAGALRDNGVAKLVGTKSFGKGSVQEVVKVTPNTSLKVTIARWLTPNGDSISEVGLKPDIEVKNTEENITKKVDAQLLKAIEILKK
ncbi:MAG: S41 family peptidase [bacterium]